MLDTLNPVSLGLGALGLYVVVIYVIARCMCASTELGDDEDA